MIPRPPRVGERAPLHPLLAGRSSPRLLTAEPVTPEERLALAEAARWAPSWGNDSPARLLFAPAGGELHPKLAATLSRGNATWAPDAPLLVLACALMVKSDGEPHKHAPYDLGQAVAHLTVQAAALGLDVHQMAGFDARTAREAAGLPDEVEPYTLVAIGRRGDPTAPGADPARAERDLRPRERTGLGELAFLDRWGVPLA